MSLPARPHYYCAKFMTVRRNQTCPRRAVRALLFASWKDWNTLIGEQKMNAEQNAPKSVPKSPICEPYVPFTDRNLAQNSPKWRIWEQCIPFTDGNSEQNSHNLPISEQCVPFTDRNSGQNSPNLPIWHKMFFFYTRVNVLFLSCKTSGPLIVSRNTKPRNSRY